MSVGLSFSMWFVVIQTERPSCATMPSKAFRSPEKVTPPASASDDCDAASTSSMSSKLPAALSQNIFVLIEERTQWGAGEEIHEHLVG